MPAAAQYAAVILELAINKTLDYRIPESLRHLATKGSRVLAPVRGVMRAGYIFELKSEPEVAKVSELSDVLSPEPLLTPELFELAIWIASYYCAPLSSVLKTVLPSSVRGKASVKQQLFVSRAVTRDQMANTCSALRAKNPAQASVLDVMLQVTRGMLLTELLEESDSSRASIYALVKKGLLRMGPVQIDRSPLVDEEYIKTKPKKLTTEQQTALDRIQQAMDRTCFETHLLHGVTGSGKTEVYLQAISHALNAGKGAIVLVPEISLTPQTVERFRSRFDDSIAVLHHRLSHGERHDEWHRIQRGDARIVIGARSAIFSPMPNLGVIIVDEEHEASYKQTDSTPCYHARDVAVMRGKLTGCPVILGTATPCLESYHNAQSGRYILSTLKARADHATIPQVAIVDMMQERDRGESTFSRALLDGIAKRHAQGEQVILFLNRRGYHTSLMCQTCRKVIECEHCDTALTFHKSEQSLCCHLCGFQLSPPPSVCPYCRQANTLRFRGLGTQQLEKALHAIFPDIRSIRMDADTTKHKGSHQKLLRDFGSGKADVLIGTQMIAKGLHFPQVTLVGILNCDTALNIPDFRASEQVFQIVTQVAGRSGRGAMPGEVVIQTLMPENRTIHLAARQDYETFFAEELEIRRLFGYPPFSQLAKILFTGGKEPNVAKAAEAFRQQLIVRLPESYEINPLLPAGHAKIKDRYRFQFLVKGPKGTLLSRAIEDLQKSHKTPKEIHVLIDINPLYTYF
jgi:primosomal protein N' (replication factor Y)